MKKIYVSPSSQIENKYATGGTTEAIQCRKIAVKLVEALKRCGFDAKTNVVDGVDMFARVRESNAWGADLHIPIHTNAFNGNVKGTRMFVNSIGSSSYKICQSISRTLNPITPGTSDSISAAPDLYEIRATNMACAYIEVAFHDNVEEAQWIIANTDKIAEAICEGVCNYYNASYVKNTKPSSKNLYRVRKSWADASSQIGAYSILENAKNACKDGYYVFDANGNIVYPASSYLVTVTAYALNIRKGPSTSYPVVGSIPKGGAYTIVETNGNWGLLKSYAKDRNGWICLDYTEKV